MIVVCIARKLTESNKLFSIESFHNSVRPLDYEFEYTPDDQYIVLSIILRMDGNLWFYLFNREGDENITIAPAVLFDFERLEFCSGMSFNLLQPDGFEILPTSLATIDRWFEKYIDEVDTVIDIVNLEVNKIRQELITKEF